MNRALRNISAFLLGCLIAAATLIPQYAQAGEGLITGQTNQVSNNRFQFGSGNPTTTYSVGESSVIDITSSGTDVTVRRGTPFTATNKYREMASGRIIDALKINPTALKPGFMNFLKGGLLTVGLPWAAQMAIDKGWEWMTDARCQVNPSCYGKKTAPSAPYSATQDFRLCLSLAPYTCSVVIPNATFDFPALCYTGTCPADILSSMQNACKSVGLTYSKGYDWNGCINSYNNSRAKFSFGTSATLSQPRPSTIVTDAELQQFADTIFANNPKEIVQDYINGKKPLPYLELYQTAFESPVITPEKTKSTVTTQNPDGSQKSETVKRKTEWSITPQGDLSSQEKETTTTTTTAPDGSTSTSSSNSSSSNDTPEETPPAIGDPAMPTVPSLYSQKYPNGLQGVWDAKKAALQNTAFVQSISLLAPSNWNAGTCPSWTINFDIQANMAYGNQVFPFPCWLVPFLKAALLLTAAFTARKLIWG